MPDVLAKMSVDIAADVSGLTKSLNQASNKLSSFASDVTKIAGTIGIAFGAKAIASFGFEVAKLAGEAEGVRAAFEKLPESEALMSRLKDATSGTVSELELMKRTVQAANFGIGLESLPQLLEFAAIRAQQTGQSVDYLVDSIVTGIGRKSPLILDNLGISAVRLKEQFGGAALEAQSIGDVAEAVGKIATEELQKMGSMSENTSTKIQRLSASWDNLKVAIGNAANSSGVLQETLNQLTNLANALAGEELTTGINQLKANLGTGSEILERFAAAGGKIDLSWQELMAKGFFKSEEAAKKYEKILADIATQSHNLSLAQKAISETDPTTGMATGGTLWKGRGDDVNKLTVTLDSLRAKVKQLNDDFETTDTNDQKKLANIGDQIIATNKQIETLERLRKAQKDASTIPNTVDAYQKAIADLGKEIESTNVKDTARIRVLSAEVASYQNAIKAVNDLKKSFTDFSDVTLKVPDLSALLNPINQVSKTEGALTFTVNEDAFSASMERIEKRLEESATKIKSTTEGISQAIEVNLTGPIASAVDGLGEALGRAAAGVGNFGQDILKVVANFGAQLGKILIAEGVALLAAKFALKNPYTAIAAGVALVAISSALNASVSKAHSSAFGGAGGAGGSSGPREAVSRFTADSQAVQVQFDARFRVEGDSLVAVLKNTDHNGQRGG